MAFNKSFILILLGLWTIAGAVRPIHLAVSQTQATKNNAPAKVALHGVVESSDGPLHDAIAYVFQNTLVAQSATNKEGKFEFDLQSDRPAQVLIVAKGMISEILSVAWTKKKAEIKIRLQKQESQPGFRIIDSQAMGVADIKLEVLSLRAGKITLPIPGATMISQLSATTDEDGWFQFPDLELSRIGKIKVTGQGIVPTMLSGESLEKTTPGKIVLVAQPARTIVGEVVDRVSKMPIRNAVITRRNGESRATVDESGRFELTGLPAFEPLVLKAESVDQPYHGIGVSVPVEQGFDPAKVNIEMEPGLWVEGHVKEFATDKPASAQLFYFPTPENKIFESFIDSIQTSGVAASRPTGSSGRARVVAAAGPGVIVLVAEGFPPNESVNKLSVEQRTMLAQFLGPELTAVQWIEPQDLEDEVQVDFVVSKGRAIEVKLAGEDISPSDLLVVHRAASKSSYGQAIRGPEFFAEQFHPGEKRQVLIHGPQFGLGAVLDLKAEAESPVTVKLEPTGRLIGRLVNKDGEPQSGLLIKFEVAVDDEYQEIATGVFTDANGRFEKPSLIATLDYRVSAVRPSNNQQMMKDSPEVDSRWELLEKLRINGDEVVDVGSIALGAGDAPKLKRSPRESTVATVNSLPSLIRGTIINESGEPIGNAAITFNTWPNRSGDPGHDMKLKPMILAQATSDSSGNFQLSIESGLEENVIKTSEGAKNAAIVIVAKKQGTMQIPLAKIADPLKLNLKMNREMVIRGRLIAPDEFDLQQINLVSGSSVRVYDNKTLEKIVSSLKEGNGLESSKDFVPDAVRDPVVGGIPLLWETSSSGAFLVRNVPMNAIFKLHAVNDSGHQKTIMVVSRPMRGFEFTIDDDSADKMQLQGSRVKFEFDSIATQEQESNE